MSTSGATSGNPPAGTPIPPAKPADAPLDDVLDQKPTSGTPRNWIFAWAILGVLALLCQAIFRLAPLAWEPVRDGTLTPLLWVFYVGWGVMNLYLEGYKGFQKKFVPRVLARAHHIALYPKSAPLLLAPAYAMAFFGATRRARIAAWAVTGAVLVAILIVRALPQPYRGIIDVGVVLGLGWGTLVLIVGAARRLLGTAPTGDPEVS